MKSNKRKISLLALGSAVILSSSALFIACNGSGGDGEAENLGAFVFSTSPASAYTLIDRHAAVEAGTVGIAAPAGLGIAPVRDLYNASNPVEDAAGVWVPEIQASVVALHSVLDDDLTALGLVPASVETSLAQAGPVIVPDIIRYNPDLPTSYPNGRNLTDQVVDLTLAAALLDLSQNGQNLRTFADLPLNPAGNDVAFSDTFPYLAAPHPAE